MKVLLVNPPYHIEEYYGRISKLGFSFPPMGILYLAAYVRQFGHEVKAYDFQANENDFFVLLKDFSPQVVGITCHTALVYSTRILARQIKERLNNCHIIVGGTHPTCRPWDLLSEESINVAVRGEGEITFLEILEYLEERRRLIDIAGISFNNGNSYINNKDRDLIKDINTLPIPALDLLPFENYHCSPDLRIGKKVMMLSTARGCPYQCSFCAMKEAFNRTYRYRNTDMIFQEIDYYVRNYSADGLFIVDELFTINKKRVFEFCDRMIKSGYAKYIKWWAQTRADCVDKEILLKMKEAGCRMLSFGIESGVDRLLKVIKKNVTTKEVKKAVTTAHAVGLDARGSFILGLPTESFLDSLKTIIFGLSLPLHRLKFGLATPYPGTGLWDVALKEGQISEDEDWNRFSMMAGYTHHRAPYVPKGRKSGELKILQLMANFLFFLKPVVIISILRYYISFRDMPGLFSAIKEFAKATFLFKDN